MSAEQGQPDFGLDRRAVDIVGECLDVTGPDQARLAQRLCAGDERLLDRVLELLNSAGSLGDFLEAPACSIRDESGARLIGAGTRIGRYTVLDVLGRGGSADVYQVVGTDAPTRFALKLLRAASAESADGGRAAQEIEALRALDDDRIVRYIDCGTAVLDGVSRWFLVTELALGLPITHAAAAEQLGWRERVELMIEVCEAVAHAHERLVLHRDLKPAHVRIVATDAGRRGIKILDFGIAGRLGRDGQLAALASTAGTIFGNDVGAGPVAYSSPEELDGLESTPRAPVSQRSDVYSLGVILYELLTGTLPHGRDGQPILAVIREVRFEPAPDLRRARPDLPRDLSKVITAALAKEPERRYRSAGELADELRRVLAGEPVLAQGASLGSLVRLAVNRHRGPALMLAATLAGVITLSVVASVQWSRASRAERIANERFERLLESGRTLMETVVPRLRQQAGASAISREVVEQMYSHFGRLAAEAPEDPRVLTALAHAARELAMASGAFSIEERQNFAQEGVRALERLASMRPGDAMVLQTLAEARTQSEFLRIDAEPAARLRSLIETSEAAIRVLPAGPERDDAEIRLAYAWRTLSGVTRETSHAERAVEIARAVRQRRPTYNEALCEYGSALGTLAALIGVTDRPRAESLAIEGRHNLLLAERAGMQGHPTIARNLGSLEIEMAYLLAPSRPTREALDLANAGLEKIEGASRGDPMVVQKRRDWGFQLAAFARAARAIVAANPPAERSTVVELVAARLESSLREFRAQPRLDVGRPDTVALAAEAERLLADLRNAR